MNIKNKMKVLVTLGMLRAQNPAALSAISDHRAMLETRRIILKKLSRRIRKEYCVCP